MKKYGKFSDDPELNKLYKMKDTLLHIKSRLKNRENQYINAIQSFDMNKLTSADF